MKPSNTPAKTTNSTIPAQKHHYFRTFFAAIFGFMSLNLIIISILVLWLGATITNTDQYVKTITPLVGSKAVQTYVVNNIANTLLDKTNDQGQPQNSDQPTSEQDPTSPGDGDGSVQNAKDSSMVQNIAEQVLTLEQRQGKNDEELKQLIVPIFKESLSTIVSSPRFAQIWLDTNRDLHKQLVAGITRPGTPVTINLHPALESVLDDLSTTKFAFIKDKLDIPADAGMITIESSRLDKARQIYSYFKTATLAIVGCALMAALLSVLISVHHWKTVRRILLFTGLLTATIGGLLSSASLIPTIKNSPEETALVKELISIIFKDLRLAMFIIAGACLTITFVSKVIGSLHNRITKKP